MALHGIALTATGAERLRERHPQLPLGDLAGGAAGLEPGRPLRLLAANGEALGAGVADPENELIRVWRAPDGGAGAGTDGGSAIHAFDTGFFRGHVRRALALRRMLGLADGVSAYRLLNGESRPHYANVREFLPEFRKMAAAANRDVPVTIWGAKEDEDMLKRDRDAGVERVIVSLESEKSDTVLPELDRWAKLAEKVA